MIFCCTGATITKITFSATNRERMNFYLFKKKDIKSISAIIRISRYVFANI